MVFLYRNILIRRPNGESRWRGQTTLREYGMNSLTIADDEQAYPQTRISGFTSVRAQAASKAA